MDDVIDCEIEQAPIRDSQGVRVGYSYTTVRANGDWCYANAFDRHGVYSRTTAVRQLSGSQTALDPSDWPALCRVAYVRFAGGLTLVERS